ncbi:MAG: hypothetical protein QOE90_353 [Thermoplasmata archaeon]|jgi:hypothetical protein|nr:hypothetical protein [Thermoplasmata archaeon]
MKAFDARTAAPFRLDWIESLDATTRDDYARAIAEKADVLLRGAQFLDLQRDTAQTEVEVRVWVEAACGSACVSITWEPRPGRYGFYLLDETLRERLACVVFEGVPCVDAPESAEQADRVLAAALKAMRDAQRAGEGPAAWADAVRDSERPFRVPVQDGPKPESDS